MTFSGATDSPLAARNAALEAEIGIAVEVKRLDARKQQGEAVVQLLQAAVKISKSLYAGANFDARA